MNIEELDRPKILEALLDDEKYYGAFGKQFLSNSDVGALINEPDRFKAPYGPNINLLLGGAFHTMVLEPHKMDKYQIVDANNRNTSIYKEAAAEAGEMLLLEKDLIKLKRWQEALDGNDSIRSILRGKDVEYEVPHFGIIEGELWKGKADAVNHADKLIIDVKTTSNIDKFGESAQKFNYDSQAYIYKTFFGYEFVFAVIDKRNDQLGFYDCSPAFYATGKAKVEAAVKVYRELFKPTAKADWTNYLIQQ